MPRYSVILPAAGSSTRFQGFPDKKPFADLAGVVIWRQTADAFACRTDVCQLQLVLAETDIPAFRERFSTCLDDIEIVTGGSSRAESVRNALKSVAPSADYIAVHDAARPLVSSTVIDRVFQTAAKSGAAIPGLPVNSTVKQTDDTGRVIGTIDRTSLRLAQTPQTFARNVLLEAYNKAADRLHEFTDEASAVEAAGHPVTVTEGSWDNIKITTANDFHLAELILKSRSTVRDA